MTQPVTAKQLAQLLDEYAAPLNLNASQWSRSPDDCVQEAFLALARQSERPENSVAWLYRVVRNHALNEFRSNQRRMVREQNAATENYSDRCLDQKNQNPAQLTQDQEERDQLLRVLDSLEPKDRELIVLRIWSGLTWVEIAELAEISSSSAQRNYVAALNHLKQLLESKCLTKPS